MKSMLIRGSKMIKSHLINEKIRKSYTTFSENKPNLKNIKIAISSCKTNKYEILPACRSEKQTQFLILDVSLLAFLSGDKPDSNPIPERPKMNTNPFNKMIYKNFMPLVDQKTNPIQTQNKPKFILEFIPECCSLDLQQGNVSLLGLLSGDKANFKSPISSLNFYDRFIRLFFGPDFDKMENWLCER